MSEDRFRLNALPTQYPRVFAAGPLPWGFEHGDGWCTLIEDLCDTINTLLLEEPSATVSTVQVKEKFGALRFYCRNKHVSDELAGRITTAIRAAEQASTQICEQCGRPARLVNRDGWLTTRCASCSA